MTPLVCARSVFLTVSETPSNLHLDEVLIGGLGPACLVTLRNPQSDKHVYVKQWWARGKKVGGLWTSLLSSLSFFTQLPPSFLDKRLQRNKYLRGETVPTCVHGLFPFVILLWITSLYSSSLFTQCLIVTIRNMYVFRHVETAHCMNLFVSSVF